VSGHTEMQVVAFVYDGLAVSYWNHYAEALVEHVNSMIWGHYLLS
jgi:hypothetical protein